ncbi:MAG: SMC-Scp complex subunit ScpB [Saprospiraceae bacterium]|nr:SMC-Scp complex subunit ScpB [Saprospiraceae bacterium]
MNRIIPHIESLIFLANPSIGFDEIRLTLNECFETNFEEAEISSAIDELMQRYLDEKYAIEIVEIGGGFRFMTKGAYHRTLSTFLRQNSHKKLSKAALETLSIIAYKQPVTKTEIELIRGVNSDFSVQKLLDKELIEIFGRSDGPGRPLLYNTTAKFMDYFGIKSMEELPKLKDIEPEVNQIGEAEPDVNTISS